MLALDGSNWMRVDLFNFQVNIEGAVIDKLSSRFGGFLKTLRLEDCKSVVDSSLE